MKSIPSNPYAWESETTKHFVGRRALLDEAVAICNGGEIRLPGQPIVTFQGGGVVVLLGTRGMGKSVFLTQLAHRFQTLEGAGIVVLSFGSREVPLPPVTALTEKLLELVPTLDGVDRTAFRRKLDELGRKGKLFELFDTYLHQFASTVERIVLMYDELDAYANSPSVAINYFNSLEGERKKLGQRVAIVAAGGLGMLSLKTVLGSSVFTRASRKVMEPFTAEEIEELASPFEDRGAPLSADVLTTLLHLSGGNLALTTYGLEKLWGIEQPSPRDVVFLFDRFRQDSAYFLDSIRQSVFGFHQSEIPLHVLARLRASTAGLSKTDLRALREVLNVETKITDTDILDILRAAGLIRMEPGAWDADPILAEIIPSVLTFDTQSTPKPRTATLQEQLRIDLMSAMADVHRMTPAFYRQGRKGQNSEMVPEQNFAAVLLISLLARGWKGNLESISGGGRADIQARYPSRYGDQEAIVEVKRWDGAAYVAGIHGQIKKYFTQNVTALATVVIGELQDVTWKDTYEKECLDGKVDGNAEWKPLERPLEGYFEARWESRIIEHFLLRLAARA